MKRTFKYKSSNYYYNYFPEKRRRRSSKCRLHTMLKLQFYFQSCICFRGERSWPAWPCMQVYSMLIDCYKRQVVSSGMSAGEQTESSRPIHLQHSYSFRVLASASHTQLQSSTARFQSPDWNVSMLTSTFINPCGHTALGMAVPWEMTEHSYTYPVQCRSKSCHHQQAVFFNAVCVMHQVFHTTIAKPIFHLLILKNLK